MNTIEMQHNLIRRILDIKDIALLEYLNSALKKDETVVKVSGIERQLLEESEEDYRKGNIISDEDVKREISEWLEE